MSPPLLPVLTQLTEAFRALAATMDTATAAMRAAAVSMLGLGVSRPLPLSGRRYRRRPRLPATAQAAPQPRPPDALGSGRRLYQDVDDPDDAPESAS